MIFLGVNVSLTFYVGIFLPYIQGIKEDVETYNPKLVTMGAVSGFLMVFSLIIAGWPVWGWYILPMVFVMFLGYISTLHFLPNNGIGSFVFFSIFFLAIASACIIAHEGYWHHSN